MTRRVWTVTSLALLAFCTASAARAQAPAYTTTTATTTIRDAGGIKTVGEVIFQDIVIAPSVTIGSVLNSSEGSASFTVLGSDAVSMSVPESFEMARQGGVETLTVQTSAGGDYSAIANLQSMLSASGTLSIDVGGSIRVSADQLAPGEYRGLLVVMAQYN